MENLTELTAKIGFNIETKKLDSLKDNLLSIKNILYATFGTIAIKSLFNQFSGIIDTFDRVRAGLFLGRQPNPVWYLLGIDPTQDPNKVFDELLKKLRQIKDVGIRRSRAAELGFNPDLMESLINTNTKGIVVKDIVNDLRSIKQSILEIIIRLTTGLAPIVKTISTFLTNWRLILDNIFLSMGGWQEGMTKLLRVFILIYAWNNKLKSLIMGLGLVLEDLWVFSKGGKSYFEEVLKYFNLTQEQIEKTRQIVNGVFEGFKEGVKTFLEVLINSIKITIKSLGDGLKLVLKTTFNYVLYLVDLINKTIHPINTIKDMFKKDDNDIEQKPTDYFNNINKNYSLDTLKDIEKTAITNTNNNKYINQNDNRNINNTFNINGAQSPQKTAEEVFNLQKQLNNTKWELE